jgi:hypothetical protein
MAKGKIIIKKPPCNKTCSPGTRLNPIICECVKIPGVPPPPPKGKKGLIIKSKKNK